MDITQVRNPETGEPFEITSPISKNEALLLVDDISAVAIYQLNKLIDDVNRCIRYSCYLGLNNLTFRPNEKFVCYIGANIYRHYPPALIKQFILIMKKSGWQVSVKALAGGSELEITLE